MEKAWVRASDVTTVEIGDRIVSCAGVEIVVLGIRLQGLHLPSPIVLVAYEFNDNGRAGIEEVALPNFRDNINS